MDIYIYGGFQEWGTPNSWMVYCMDCMGHPYLKWMKTRGAQIFGHPPYPDTVTSFQDQRSEPGVDGKKFAFVLLPCLMVNLQNWLVKYGEEWCLWLYWSHQTIRESENWMIGQFMVAPRFPVQPGEHLRERVKSFKNTTIDAASHSNWNAGKKISKHIKTIKHISISSRSMRFTNHKHP